MSKLRKFVLIMNSVNKVSCFLVVCSPVVLYDRPKKLSFNKLKRRLCKFPARSVSIDERLSGLTEHLTVIEDGDAYGNGQRHEERPLNQQGLL